MAAKRNCRGQAIGKGTEKISERRESMRLVERLKPCITAEDVFEECRPFAASLFFFIFPTFL